MPDAVNVNQTDSTQEEGYLSEYAVPEHEVGLYPTSGRAHRPATLEDVNADAISHFHEHGYLVVDRGISDEMLKDSGDALYDLIDGKVSGFKSVTVESGARESFKTMGRDERRAVVRKVFNFVDAEPRLGALMADGGIVDVVRRMMGDEPVHLQDMALLKPPRIGREKPWHQDCAYFNVPIDTTVVGVWVAIDAATLENGCLHVIPGSHKEGPHPHFKVRDWQICDTDVRATDGVPVPLEPGGILFWHGLTHHGSPTNGSDQGRRGIQLHYQPKQVGKLTTEERMEYYGGEGLGMTC